jgi:alpha-tubulin suppressor-like RCC1 family protein
VYSAAVCWGDNSSGQLGNGTTTNSAVPVALSVDRGFEFFSAGTLFTCAYNQGTVVSPSCWGNNGVGQLGNGTTTNSTTAVIISGKLDFNSMSSGGMHACAAVNNYPGPHTYCWGDNGSGQLGNGTMTNSATPVAVAGSSLYFAGVSAGGSHTCGAGGLNGGAVYCWGDNTFGQLGNSWTTSSSMPVNVAESP